MTSASTHYDTPVLRHKTLSGAAQGPPVRSGWPSAGFGSQHFEKCSHKVGGAWHGKADPEQSEEGSHTEDVLLGDTRAQVGEKGVFVKEGVAAGMNYWNKQKD